jgi:predicted NBD/HSP70 family sugar kinase
VSNRISFNAGPIPRRGQRPEDGHRQNRETVMGLLRRRAQGRADLSRALGLSKTALGGLIGDLVEEGLVVESQARHPDSARRGRKPALLKVNARRASVIGVDLSATVFEFGVYDLTSDLLSLEHLPSRRGAGQLSVYAHLLGGIQKALQRARTLGFPVAAVGVAAPGPLDAQAGVILVPPAFPELHHLHLKSRLEFDLGLPVRLERNSTAAATAYLRQCDSENFVYLLLLEQGIGAGLVVDRNVYRGAHGYAGEFGHVSLDVNGPPCPCGNRGCLERLADVDAIRHTYVGRGQPDLPLDQIVERAQQGEGAALEVLTAAGRAIGLAAVSLVNILDPRMLVLGGPGARASPFLIPALRHELGARAYPYLRWGEHLDIHTCSLPNPVGRGAAECVLNALYRGDIPLVGWSPGRPARTSPRHTDLLNPIGG